MRIALVDPSRTTRLIVTRLLEARGHEAVPFADEREALNQIKIDLRIDAVITSAELTHMSGVELCWETRLLASHRRPIYVLMMSSHYDQQTLVEALDSGADDFIGKPPLARGMGTWRATCRRANGCSFQSRASGAYRQASASSSTTRIARPAYVNSAGRLSGDRRGRVDRQVTRAISASASR